ncbi:MAG: nucleoside deaminase [Proteobacteria bacterium]|nr:nucleoside deaminase [Pseudomonadota bacterium]
MALALLEADRAGALGEVPVGAVVVDAAGEVLAAGHNRRQCDRDPTAHAEVLVLREAARRRGDWRLAGTSLYVTLEPCPMCAGALVNARVGRLVYGCADPKAGAVRTLFSLCSDARLNHRVEIVSGVLAERCGQRLSAFFAQLRAKKEG